MDVEHADQWPIIDPSQANMPAQKGGSTRDGLGRFLTGNSGGGRRKGSRNKLTERFLDTIANDFAEHGIETIAKVRTTDPAAYLKIISSLLPREMILQREQSPAINWDQVTYEELAELVEDRRRQQSMEKILKSIDG